MLIISRRMGEAFFIGENLESRIVLLEHRGSQVKIGIDAHDHYRILREELMHQHRKTYNMPLTIEKR